MNLLNAVSRKILMTGGFRQRATLCLVMFLGACSSPGPYVNYHLDPSVDFSRLHDWNWAPKKGELKTPAAITTAERIQLESLVNGEVERLLDQKGFSHRRDNPAFWIAWSFGEWELSRKHRPNDGYGSAGLMYPGLHGSIPRESRDGRALPPSLDPYSSRYEEAKIELVVIDPATSRVIWDATVTDDTDFGYYRPTQQNRIRAAVQKILQDFPPLHKPSQ